MYLKQGSNYGLTLPNYSVIGEGKTATAGSGGRRTKYRLTALVLVTSSTVPAK